LFYSSHNFYTLNRKYYDQKKNLQNTARIPYSFLRSKIYWMTNVIIADPEVLEEEQIPQKPSVRQAYFTHQEFAILPMIY